MIELSVLICSTHTRAATFGRKIQDQVWGQFNALPKEYQERIEIIMLTDNKQMMLGQKRNILVDMAQGAYVQFIDDDDRIEPDMFKLVLDAIQFNTDVITFPVSVMVNGSEPKLCFYSIKYDEDRNLPHQYERLPNHIMVVKRELAIQVSFPNTIYGEDAGYSKLLKPLLLTEHQIDKVLYHYDSDTTSSETQEYRPGTRRMRKAKAMVDVVIMSKAEHPRLKQMTQNTIDTCIAGANSMPLHIVVIEQQKGIRYEHAQTVFAGDEFNYNRFANRGAALGFAPWIMVANNDLIFRDGWLHQLLLANQQLVSPKNPYDRRQEDITEITSGSTNGRHLSGWCFMMTRSLWHEIGGLDEEVKFWFCDDVVIEQCKEFDVLPTMVPKAIVEHLVSETLNRNPERDELTWGQVEIFNRKYGQNKFVDDPRFQEWKSKNASKIALS